MFFGLFILVLLALAFLGLVCGALVPPFLYGSQRNFALLLNVTGFAMFVPVMTLFGMVSAAEPWLIALLVALMFAAVELLVVVLRLFWLRVVARTCLR